MRSKSAIRIVIAFVLCPSFAAIWDSAVPAQTVAKNAAVTISDLGWMSGDWQTAKGGRAQIDEHWTLPAGATMLGMGRTVVGEKTVEFEFLRIEQRANGIYYVASPNGGPTTDFKMTRLIGQEVIFENPEHDFPKRIVYKKISDGSLVASVDAGENTKSQNFVYFPVRK